MIYIDTESTSPFFNFAVEEYFTKIAPIKDTLFLFWQTEPTVMVGKYQNIYQEVNLQKIKEKKINLVRRVTGGGTIYTDLGGWQFSFIEPKVADEITFTTFMEPIVQALHKLNVFVEYNSRNDLTIEGKKISGNAQCVSNTCTLHHGSLLYETDVSKMLDYLNVPDYKLKAKGIKSIRERTTNISQHLPQKITSGMFKEQLIQNILQEGTSMRLLTEQEKNTIEKIAESKFKSWDWTYGKEPKFTLQKSIICSGGKVVIDLTIEKGRIEDCQISGDFFSIYGVEALENLLIHEVYEKEILQKKLLDAQVDNWIHQVSTNDLLTCLFE